MVWKVINDYATISTPIIRLQQKDVKFDENKKYQNEFDIFKKKLSIYLVLRPSNWSLTFYVLSDASFVAISNTLCQASREKNKHYVIAFANRQLNLVETNYITIK